MGLPNPSRETKFSSANSDREMFIFPVQLTTSRIGNLIRLIHTLAMCVTIHNALCMVITYSRVWINRVRLPILLAVLMRDGLGRPVPR